uniref:Reverse transcriptase n=1 Tax=Ascaris lumbricoides TaxID=6252 RepID=A0A0M3HYB1_ASCLU
MFADDCNRVHSVVAHAKGNEKIFVISRKSWSRPLKDLTIPRLELLALNLNDIPRSVWSDSKCVLPCINSPPAEKLPRFVQNRLNEIKRTTNVKYGYAATWTNPADFATGRATHRALADEHFIATNSRYS